MWDQFRQAMGQLGMTLAGEMHIVYLIEFAACRIQKVNPQQFS